MAEAGADDVSSRTWGATSLIAPTPAEDACFELIR